MRYLDPVALARLRNLRLPSRRAGEADWSGRHRSARRGVSQEFAGHRAYAPGDEPKRIDWRAYARQDRLSVRESQEESGLRTYLLVDASGSMAFAHAGRASKWETACRLAMAEAYLTLSRGDAAGLAVFDVEPRSFLPSRQRLAHLELMDSALERSSVGGETDLGRAVARVAARLPRRARVVVVSDLLGDAAGVLETAAALRARKNQLTILQVLDPLERDLDLEGATLFTSLEDGETLLAEAALVREGYREAFERQQRLYEASFHRAGARYGVFYCGEGFDAALTRLIALEGPG